MVAVSMATRKTWSKSFMFGVGAVVALFLTPLFNSWQPMIFLDGDIFQTRASDPGDVNSGPSGATPSTTSNVVYPLDALNLPSAQEAYQRGFWQRADPVPLDRWQATANTTCIPHSVPVPDWKRRVPHVIMIGAQKAGTTALSYYLYNHPLLQYIPSKELHYFDEDLDQNPTLLVNGSGISATKVLDFYQENTIGDMVPLDNFRREGKYALDATPNYMWLSDRVPHRILCATPWVKLLAVLRNPVDRAYSQYHMQFHRDLSHPEIRRGFVTFEEYIALDMKVLQDTGVLPKGYGGWHGDDGQTNPSLDPSYIYSKKATEAWAIYTKLGVNSPVGRGLYAFQLKQWFEVMDIYNKPRSDLMVLSSQRLLDAPNATYTETVRFLGLPPHSLAKYSKVHETHYRESAISPEIRVKLQAFYAPFNRQLKDLLPTNKEWDGIWEETP